MRSMACLSTSSSCWKDTVVVVVGVVVDGVWVVRVVVSSSAAIDFHFSNILRTNGSVVVARLPPSLGTTAEESHNLDHT